jgi:hypothetical protein
MIKITYKPLVTNESQAFLYELSAALDPLDEIRKAEMEKAENENLPAMGGAIEEIISNPVNWQIGISAAQLIVSIVQIYLATKAINTSKDLKITINNYGNLTVNLNNYGTDSDLKADLEKKLLNT